MAANVQPPHDGVHQHHPVLERCITRPPSTVLPFDATLVDDRTDEPRLVDVMKAMDPQRAYMRINDFPPLQLDHPTPGWGIEYPAVVLHRVGGREQETAAAALTFQCPNPEDAEYVTIMRLSKAVVHARLGAGGGGNNPYRVVQQMQRIGDNVHVLGLAAVDGALEDDNYLYCVMPYFRSVADVIFGGRSLPMATFSSMVENIRESIAYLSERGIHDANVGLENLVILGERVVFRLSSEE
jgi:hypothetical protein